MLEKKNSYILTLFLLFLFGNNSLFGQRIESTYNLSKYQFSRPSSIISKYRYDPNSDSYEESFQIEESKSQANTVETSPLIPDWANQTENPAFFQNLDIPTFLRRRGSNRPRQ